MVSNAKVLEYIDKLETDKLLIETHFANIERIVRENDDIDKDKLVGLLSNFSTLNIQYDQLCHDLITFLKIFQSDNDEIRMYKTDELIELLNQKALEFEN